MSWNPFNFFLNQQKPAAGPVCATCRRNPANPGFSWCQACYQQQCAPPSPQAWPQASQGPPAPVGAAAGQMCVACGCHPANPGFNMCQSCYQAPRPASYAPGARSMCAVCRRQPTNPGRKWCEMCYRASQAQGGQAGGQGTGRPVMSGVCLVCSVRPVNPGRSWCQACFDYNPRGTPTASACPAPGVLQPQYQNASAFPVSGVSQQPAPLPNVPLGRTTLMLMLPSHANYEKIKTLFTGVFLHDYRFPEVLALYAVFPERTQYNRFEAYKNKVAQDNPKVFGHGTEGNTQMMFHGTALTCDLSDPQSKQQEPCSDPNCSVCRILEGGFKFSKVMANTSFARPNQGMCFTSLPDTSSMGLNTPCFGILLCKVVVGNYYKAVQEMNMITEPPQGFHSVLGNKLMYGVPLDYDEVLVYDEAAAVPSYLLVCKKK